MLLDLNKLHGRREHVERTLPPSAFEPSDPDYRVVAPVHVSMDVAKAGADAFTVTGRAATRLELSCSRCVEPFEIPIDAEFDLQYVPHAENTGEGEREITEDDLVTAYYRDGMLDIVDLLREQFQLTLPMKPLCSDACRGLCPQCGANMNSTECGCAPAWEDPRLAPLKSLLTRPKEN
ncbi:MAG TPA: DUF177 domain-containing protein [Vicinamibacterales bacterium]|nr:DUF177 domain-containing protein [Vicinamibacterales bacterium]